MDFMIAADTNMKSKSSGAWGQCRFWFSRTGNNEHNCMKTLLTFLNGSVLRLSLPLSLSLMVAAPVLADPAITTGSESGALKYYKNEESLFQGLKLEKGTTSIDDLTAYLGYSVTGEKLENLDPSILMSPTPDASNGGLGATGLL
jgi:hypothetical protein